MAIKLKPLREQVIVITGASSGIGLATARRAAQAGAKLVLAARSEDDLATVVGELTNKGAEAIHVAADVGRRAEVQRIADAARQHFGRIDTWVNDAGVSIYGRLEEVAEDDHRRLIETNFWGVVNGSLVALPQLKRQGGALINIGSVLSDMAIPLQGMYSASKHAVKGFTDALRMELEHEGAPVSVTLIKPAAINTPYTEHAKNYTANQPALPPPVYEPEEVAGAILYAAAHPKRDIFVGSAAKLMSMTSRTAPRVADKLGEMMYNQQMRKDGQARRSEGLQQPGRGGRAHGDHRGYVMKRSFYSRASRHPVLTGLAVAAVGATAYTLATQRRSRRAVVGLD